MISKAVELALQASMQSGELRMLKDETLIWVLRERFPDNSVIAHLLDCLESRRLYRPAYVLTVSIGEEKRRKIVDRFHDDIQQRDTAERAIAADAGIEARDIILYCPSFGMSLQEAEVPVRTEGGRIMPLSASNNEEIRILREKHNALWKFYVFIDRRVWDKRDLVRTAAAAQTGVE
jgi:hypothetical protein